MLEAVHLGLAASSPRVGIQLKPPFRPVFRAAASREGSGIRIVNGPLDGSSVFLVETGESRTPRPEEATQDILQA